MKYISNNDIYTSLKKISSTQPEIDYDRSREALDLEAKDHWGLGRLISNVGRWFQQGPWLRHLFGWDFDPRRDSSTFMTRPNLPELTRDYDKSFIQRIQQLIDIRDRAAHRFSQLGWDQSGPDTYKPAADQWIKATALINQELANLQSRRDVNPEMLNYINTLLAESNNIAEEKGLDPSMAISMKDGSTFNSIAMLDRLAQRASQQKALASGRPQTEAELLNNITEVSSKMEEEGASPEEIKERVNELSLGYTKQKLNAFNELGRRLQSAKTPEERQAIQKRISEEGDAIYSELKNLSIDNPAILEQAAPQLMSSMKRLGQNDLADRIYKDNVYDTIGDLSSAANRAKAWEKFKSYKGGNSSYDDFYKFHNIENPYTIGKDSVNPHITSNYFMNDKNDGSKGGKYILSWKDSSGADQSRSYDLSEEDIAQMNKLKTNEEKRKWFADSRMQDLDSNLKSHFVTSGSTGAGNYYRLPNGKFLRDRGN